MTAHRSRRTGRGPGGRGRRRLGGRGARPARTRRPGPDAGASAASTSPTCSPPPAPGWPRSPSSRPASPVWTPTASPRSQRAGRGRASSWAPRRSCATTSRSGCGGWASITACSGDRAARPRRRRARRGARRPPGRRRARGDPRRRRQPRTAGWSRCGDRPAHPAAPRSRSGSPPSSPGPGTRRLLLDVDPYGGAVAQHLGVLDEVSGLLAAARSANAGLLDVERLGGFARQVGDAAAGAHRPAARRPVAGGPSGGVRATCSTSRRGLAAHVVLDTGFSLETDTADPFGGRAPQRNRDDPDRRTRGRRGASWSAPPTRSGWPGWRAGLVELRDLLPGVRPRVVVNRTRPSLGWSDREIRGMVEGFVTPLDVHFLPDDRAAADRALMAGQSLAETGESPLRPALAARGASRCGETRRVATGRRGLRRRRAGRAR